MTTPDNMTEVVERLDALVEFASDRERMVATFAAQGPAVFAGFTEALASDLSLLLAEREGLRKDNRTLREGWVMVPPVPTTEMLDAMERAANGKRTRWIGSRTFVALDGMRFFIAEAYRAMLATIPTGDQ